MKMYVDYQDIDIEEEIRNTIPDWVIFTDKFSHWNSYDIDIAGLYNKEELLNVLYKEYNWKVHLPIYIYDHSGITINSYGFHMIDPHGWDWLQVGFIGITKENLDRYYNSDENYARESLEKAIEYIDSILTGDVWRCTLSEIHHVTVVDTKTGKKSEEVREENLENVSGVGFESMLAVAKAEWNLEDAEDITKTYHHHAA